MPNFSGNVFNASLPGSELDEWTMACVVGDMP